MKLQDKVILKTVCVPSVRDILQKFTVCVCVFFSFSFLVPPKTTGPALLIQEPVMRDIGIQCDPPEKLMKTVATQLSGCTLRHRRSRGVSPTILDFILTLT